MTSSNGNIYRVIGPLCGEFMGLILPLPYFYLAFTLPLLCLYLYCGSQYAAAWRMASLLSYSIQNKYHRCLNSLMPSDAYMDSNVRHHLNQSWPILSWMLENKLQWNFDWYTMIVIDEKAFQNIIYKIWATLPRASMSFIIRNRHHVRFSIAFFVFLCFYTQLSNQ